MTRRYTQRNTVVHTANKMEGRKPDEPAQQRHRGSSARGRGWRRRLVALVAGTFLALVALEAMLWILAAVFRPEEDRISLAGRPGERTIVCIGDSNTYGVGLEPDSAV